MVEWNGLRSCLEEPDDNEQHRIWNMCAVLKQSLLVHAQNMLLIFVPP